ncbi:rRNA N6-adenosine-methyltransferase METTL5 [Planococcus citri]|uniref:rRNA N6-adenosine-methyltransferase METTL5 n=1 Tax=Planococcus citri TaxID=170843 RepID=UPI0031F9BF43
MATIKRSKLEEYLQDVETFSSPKISLEQYITPPHIAACMLHVAQSSFDDLNEKFVADLGCGSGMLSIGSLLLGSSFCIGFDIDADILNTYKSNMDEFEFANFDTVLCDVDKNDLSKFQKCFDTVLMNPPFGTHNKGIDMKFLKTAINLSSNAVYSLHKTSTRDHILSKIESWKIKGEVIAELRYDLPNSYKFHKKKSVDIAVDLYRFWDLRNKMV